MTAQIGPFLALRDLHTGGVKEIVKKNYGACKRVISRRHNHQVSEPSCVGATNPLVCY